MRVIVQVTSSPPLSPCGPVISIRRLGRQRGPSMRAVAVRGAAAGSVSSSQVAVPTSGSMTALNTPRCRPGRSVVGWPRSAGTGVTVFDGPTGTETASPGLS
ncbi:MAG: hypothetical protein U0237_01870 [Thermoleophilia bacterium]